MDFDPIDNLNDSQRVELINKRDANNVSKYEENGGNEDLNPQSRPFASGNIGRNDKYNKLSSNSHIEDNESNSNSQGGSMYQ